MEILDIASQLGNMKEVEYRNTLAITSIIELLLEKNILTKEDLSKKAEELDQMAFLEIIEE